MIYLPPFLSCVLLSTNVTVAGNYTRTLLLSSLLPCTNKRQNSRLLLPLLYLYQSVNGTTILKTALLDAVKGTQSCSFHSLSHRKKSGNLNPSHYRSLSKTTLILSHCIDLPTAFHTILGTTLFMFGCIIDSDASLALEGEPKTPTPYWLAAIDVFETGESLPIRTSGRLPRSMPEDWRMSASWGRTLVKLTLELLKRRKANPALREPPPMPDYSNFKVPQPSLPTPFRTYTADEPNWPRASLFATIAFLRPPFTRRLSLDTLSPDEIMGFAEDHLTRAIFHMPHPRNVIPARYPYQTSNPLPASSAPPPLIDSEIERNGPDRPQEIYTLASEMLFVAENSETPSARFRWARWADGVISHVKVAPNMNPQKFLDLRAKCNLAMGSAKMEELLANWDYPSVLDSDDAEDGREYFKNAATLLGQLITSIEEDIEGMEFDNGEGGSGNTSELVHDENDLYRMKILRSEALIELGNLTADSQAREELYAEAKRVGGPKIVLDDESGLDLDENRESIYGEDQMDETE